MTTAAATRPSLDLSKYTFHPGDIVEAIEVDDIDALGLHDLDGNPITEKSCWDASIEDEKRLYLGLTPGGKSLSRDGKHSPRRTITLPRDIDAKVASAARESGMSVSKWLRRVVEEKVTA